MRTSDILLYLTPFLMGFMGWFTNWVVAKLLFKPEKPVKVLFFTVQGIFPQKQKKLAEKIGKLAADEFSLADDFKHRVLQKDSIDDNILPFIESKIDHYLDVKFSRKYSITSVFFGKNRRLQIKLDLMDEIRQLAPEIIEKVMVDMDEKIDLEEMITEKVESLSSDKLEKLFNGVLGRQLIMVQLAGGVLGFVVGAVQVFFIKWFQ